MTLITSTGGGIRGVKRTGDSCLDDGAVDLEGAVAAGAGSGRAFGRFGDTVGRAGQPYDLTVVSPTLIRLSGRAGTLQYTREYTRLSWPGLAPASEPHTSSLLGIPTPTQTLTKKNVLLSGLLAVLLFAMVAFPTTVFNSTLDANLDHYRALLARVPRRRRERADDAVRPIWHQPRGIALYLVMSGLLYSVMQPQWGFNVATIITFLGFTGAFVLTGQFAVWSTRSYLARQYHDASGHTLVEISTLVIAAVCVLGSRAVGFVPGYLYGVFLVWEPNHRLEETDLPHIALVGGCFALVVTIVSWLLIPVMKGFSGDAGSISSVPLAIDSGVFVTSVEALTIGMIPLRFLPGAMLRENFHKSWILLWCAGGFLFTLVLLRPGLVSGQSRNVVGTVVLAACVSAAAFAFWLFHRVRPRPSPVVATTQGSVAPATHDAAGSRPPPPEPLTGLPPPPVME